MPNPYVNKVVVNDVPIIDLTQDTITASDLRSGVTAHSMSGSPITGTLTVPTVQASKNYSALANGNFTITPDSGNDGMASVSLSVNVPSSGATEPYIEETYDNNGNITGAVLHGHSVVRDYLFYSCNMLTSVSMPNGITSIGWRSFYNCTNLALTSLPSGITSIGEYAFSNCTNLALTSLPSGITSIDKRTFYRCTNLALTSLPSGITSIGDNAFNGCTNLALTSLPSGITSIEESTFTSCSILALTSLPSGLTSIGDYAFNFCNQLALTSLPNGLTSIGIYGLRRCYNMTIDLLPSSITNIGNQAFEGNRNMENLEIACTTLGTGTKIFASCTRLRKIWFRSTCTSVKADSSALCPFYGCSTSLKIYVEATEKPSGYGAYFNRTGSNGATIVEVVYGQTTRPW